jgi:hypothetical protein
MEAIMGYLTLDIEQKEQNGCNGPWPYSSKYVHEVEGSNPTSRPKFHISWEGINRLIF